MTRTARGTITVGMTRAEEPQTHDGAHDYEIAYELPDAQGDSYAGQKTP